MLREDRHEAPSHTHQHYQGVSHLPFSSLYHDLLETPKNISLITSLSLQFTDMTAISG